MTPGPKRNGSLTRYAWLSFAAALLTIVLKMAAYLLTGSVGLLSDALESLVNLVGALMALAMLSVAARPADEEHAYGHGKAEYFSSGVEGTLILIAALGIGVAAVQRLLAPRPLEEVGVGIAVSVAATVVNFLVAVVLLKAGKRYGSITLQANAQHLLTDVWTTAGVLIGVGAVALTDLEWLDPVVALVVAGSILRTGGQIVRDSVAGLMDVALPPEIQATIQQVLEPYEQSGIRCHALRTRQSGTYRFVSLHVLVPGNWTVENGHRLLERIEGDLVSALPNLTVFTHLESLNDPASWDDSGLGTAPPPDRSHPKI